LPRHRYCWALLAWRAFTHEVDTSTVARRDAVATVTADVVGQNIGLRIARNQDSAALVSRNGIADDSALDPRVTAIPSAPAPRITAGYKIWQIGKCHAGNEGQQDFA
jgi:hypothetical protein